MRWQPTRRKAAVLETLQKPLNFEVFISRGEIIVLTSIDIILIHIYRGLTEAVMRAFAPQGFVTRRPNSKQLKRSTLVAVGPDAEWSVDGHDKLKGIGMEVYGIRDKWGGKFIHYVVLPSNRFADIIGVVLLDCVLKCGGTLD